MLTSTALNVVILAAGRGTRMCSAQPKVMQKLAGRPVLQYVIQSARTLSPAKIIVVYGYGGAQVKAFLENQDLILVEQPELLGTGHALLQAVPYLDRGARILVLYGDVPLIRAETLKLLIDACSENKLVLLTQFMKDPHGYGRIVRDLYGSVTRIVEEKDADENLKEILEINTGFMCIPETCLNDLLVRLENGNAQKEYYLTDVVELAVSDGMNVDAVSITDSDEALGINDRYQLACAEKALRTRSALELLREGVTLMDPERIDVRGEIVCGKDVEIDVGCIFEGKISIGNNVKVGAYSILRDVYIGNDVKILPYTLIEESHIDDSCRIGPYARIRPGTKLGREVHIGDFVEIKNATIGNETKINHMSYVGDSEVGQRVNIGAGTITCNYDGANKNHTVIGDDVFIGSDSQLVAPVVVESGATIGAGSTITRTVAEGTLALSRVKQTSVSNWVRPQNNNKQE